MASQNPLRAVFQIRRSELPLAVLMFSYFFLVITSFFTDFAAVRWLAAFSVPIIVLWIFAVRYAGRQSSRRTEG